MRTATAYRSALGAFGFFVLATGDFWRYLISWWGWGALTAVLLVLVVIEIARERVSLRNLPYALLVLLGFATLSIAWSAYRLETAIAVATTLATTAGAVFFACCFTWRELRDVFTTALRWVLGLSIAFELAVSLIIRERVLPFWVDYSDLDKIPAAFYWSRNLLLEGGRIQGIVGNSNLLGMLAVLALLIFVVRLLAREGSPIWAWFWTAVAVATIALTRSATALVVLAALVLVSAFLLVARSTHGRARRLVTVGGVVVAAVLAAAAVVFRAPLLGLLGKSSDLTHRLSIWESVWELAVQRPVAGWGWISYWAPWVEPFDDLAVYRGVTYLQAHNAWLDVFLQLGAIGVLLLAVLALTALVRTWMRAVDTDDPDSAWPGSAVPLLIIVALLTQSLTESRLLIELGLTLLAVVAIKTSWANESRDAREREHARTGR